MITIYSNKIIKLQKTLARLGFASEAKKLSDLTKIASRIINPRLLAPKSALKRLENIIILIENIKNNILDYSQYYKADPELVNLSSDDIAMFFSDLFQKTNTLSVELDYLRQAGKETSYFKEDFKNSTSKLTEELYFFVDRFYKLIAGKHYGSSENKKIKKITLLYWVRQFDRLNNKIKDHLKTYDYLNRENISQQPTFVFDPADEFAGGFSERTDPGIFLNKSLPQPSPGNIEKTQPAEEIIEFTEN